MPIHGSLLQSKAQQQLSDFQTPSHMSTGLNKISFSQLKVNAKSKVGNRDRDFEDPEMRSSRNVAFNVFLGGSARNTRSALSEISPLGSKCIVRSYLPGSTEEAPKHE